MADESMTSPESGASTPAGNGGGGDEPKFTQADLDRLVKDRLARQKQQFADYDEIKAKAAKLEEIESSKQSEAEKLLAAIDKANKAAQEAQERERAASEKAQSTLIRAAVISEASKQKAVDPDAVYALLDRSNLTIGDDDQVTGVEDAVKGLLEQRSYLVGSQRPSGGFDGGARTTAPADTTAADFNAQLRKEAGFA